MFKNKSIQNITQNIASLRNFLLYNILQFHLLLLPYQMNLQLLILRNINKHIFLLPQQNQNLLIKIKNLSLQLHTIHLDLYRMS